MVKFYGKLGIAFPREVSPGVHDTKIIEHNLHGEVLDGSRYLNRSDTVNNEVTLSDRFSLIMPRPMYEQKDRFAYILHQGTKWRVESVSGIDFPRVVVTVGGVYHD